jgi:hypothetical protein
VKVQVTIEADYPDEEQTGPPYRFDVRIKSTQDAYLDMLGAVITSITPLSPQ